MADLYEIARRMASQRPDLGLAFSVQPNIFGVSIDLIKAGSYLRSLIEDRHRPVGRPDTSAAGEKDKSLPARLKRLMPWTGSTTSRVKRG